MACMPDSHLWLEHKHVTQELKLHQHGLTSHLCIMSRRQLSEPLTMQQALLAVEVQLQMSLQTTNFVFMIS